MVVTDDELKRILELAAGSDHCSLRFVTYAPDWDLDNLSDYAWHLSTKEGVTFSGDQESNVAFGRFLAEMTPNIAKDIVGELLELREQMETIRLLNGGKTCQD